MSIRQVGILNYFSVLAGAVGRFDQGGHQDEGAQDNFRRETRKHCGGNHTTHSQKQKRFHHSLLVEGLACSLMYTATVWINVYGSSRNLKVFMLLSTALALRRTPAYGIS